MRNVLAKNLLSLCVVLLFSSAVSGCFINNLLPGQGDKSSSTTKHDSTIPETILTPNPPPPLSPGRLVRRLALDLTDQLPASSDVDTATANPDSLVDIIDAYLNRQDVNKAIGLAHTRMWELDRGTLPTLDRYIAAGNNTLDSELTPALRQQASDEVGLMIRYALDQNRPFTALFSQSYSIVHDSLVSVWNQASDGRPWVGEPYYFATFSDARPAAGILVSNGFLANFDDQNDTTLRHRTRLILQAIECQNLQSSSAHTFTSLSAAEMQSDLTALSVTKTECRGCHAQFEDTAQAFLGLAQGTSFSSWLAYNPPSAASAQGSYSGHAFAGLAELAGLIGNDPRTHRCEVEKLMSHIYQRALTSLDTATVVLALQDFYSDNLDLRSAVKALIHTNSYAYDVVDKQTDATLTRSVSGAKLLSTRQWQGIIDQIAPASGLSSTNELSAGFDETLTSHDSVPTGTYWHYANKLARELASTVVATELADSSQVASRHLFLDLADGSGASASSTTIDQQIKDVWKILTAETLADASTTHSDLLTLWTDSLAGGTSADDFRRAWRTVLVGILLHPRFLTY